MKRIDYNNVNDKYVAYYCEKTKILYLVALSLNKIVKVKNLIEKEVSNDYRKLNQVERIGKKNAIL